MGKDRKSDRGNSHWNIFLIVKKSLYLFVRGIFVHKMFKNNSFSKISNEIFKR